MKQLRMMAAAVALLLAPVAAHAGAVICFQAGQAESLQTVATCAKNPNPGVAGWQTFVTMDCDASAQEGFVWHFFYPTDAPFTTSDFTPQVFWNSSAGGGDVKWQFDIACTKVGQNYSAQTSGGNATVTTTSGATNDVSSQSSAITMSGIDSSYSKARCTWRVNRIAADGADTLSVDARITGGCLNY